ncbi:polymorphic toxin type 50 domain-containing protein [Lactobacillus taiwanensis]|nr:polymorphic toxin type 50 domain-containing protein [Lactobacillus taiwanensis]
MTTVKQEKQRINQLLSRDAKTDGNIDEIYNEAVDKLRAVVNQVFDKYSVDGVLVPANLHKKVTRSDMLLLKRQYDKLPDELELPEIERRDNYTAISQTSQRGLITATLGMALIGVTHLVVNRIKKNNATAVNDEVRYIQKNNDLSKTQNKCIRVKAKKIEKPDYTVENNEALRVPWLDRIWLDHDKLLNRVDSNINDMLKQGMRAEDITDKLFPENADSMRQDNIPKAVREASISAKRLARTEAATREDDLTEQAFKSKKVKYYDWVTEPGACKKCLAIANAGPYKFGDPDSPRPPMNSHPNCRCRRVPVDADEINAGKLAILAGSLSSTAKKSDKDQNDSSKIVAKRIEDGVWKDEINLEKQKRHLPVDVERTPEDGHSRTIFNSDVDIEALYNKYKGTGHIARTRKGKLTSAEVITTNHVLAYDNKGRKLYGFKIHYSKTGVHLVPWKGENNSEFK